MNPIAFYKISYGLYVISSHKGDLLNGQIANTVNQVTAEPAQVAIAINHDNLTYEYIKESQVFSASVLSQDTPMPFIGQFGFKSGRVVNKFENIEYRIGQTGAPITLDNTVAFLEAKVVDSMNVGTHTIFVGEVMDTDILLDQEPMTYAYYHLVKGGKSPKNAPTYQKSQIEIEGVSVDSYKCQICGYVYDPKHGDPDTGIPPMTPFEELPDDWKCPICGAPKDKFDKTKEHRITA